MAGERPGPPGAARPGGLWLLLQVLGVLTALVRGGPGDVPWVTVVVLLSGAVAVVVLRRRLRRSLELNGGPPA